MFIRLLVICIVITSCAQKDHLPAPDAHLSLITEHDRLHYLQIKDDISFDWWELPYPVYRFQTGDIDQDGELDMMVGVIKATRFDSTNAKRIFIFKNYNGLVRPLWLGSRMGQPIEDFIFIQTTDGPRIRCIEIEKSGRYLVADYKWRKFGMEFTQYLAKETDIKHAYQLLNHQ